VSVGGGGELADHGQEQLAVAVVEVGGVAADLGEELELVVRELVGVELAAQRIFREELRDGQVEGERDLGERVERRDRVAVFDAGEVATEQAGFLLDIALREAALEAVRTNRSADFNHGGFPVNGRGSLAAGLSNVVTIVNMQAGRMQGKCR
jgi:hypothetical protein